MENTIKATETIRTNKETNAAFAEHIRSEIIPKARSFQIRRNPVPQLKIDQQNAVDSIEKAIERNHLHRCSTTPHMTTPSSATSSGPPVIAETEIPSREASERIRLKPSDPTEKRLNRFQRLWLSPQERKAKATKGTIQPK